MVNVEFDMCEFTGGVLAQRTNGRANGRVWV